MTVAPLSLSRVADALRAGGLLLRTRGASDVEIRGVAQDSRLLERGDLFLAWVGVDHDAHHFVAEAARRGAAAAVVEREVPDADLPQIVVADGRLAGALVADLVLGSPWKALFLAGVTGTNGKTTTTLLIRHLLSRRYPAAAIGTLGLVGPDGRIRPETEGLTTPGPVQLSGWLRGLVDEGVRGVVLEASSHALQQRRLDGARFDVAVFTNLSHDHLDYHPSWSEYFRSKARLLDLLKPDGVAVVNADDPAWRALPDEGGKRIGWGFNENADVRGTDVELLGVRSRFGLRTGDERVEVNLPLAGRFNVENALAAAAVGLAAGLSPADIADALDVAPQIPGRVEIVERDPFLVVIDFAHTPGALRGVLAALRPLVEGRLIVVFGAGGDRDRAKRPDMGRAVSEVADVSVLTSDNPRNEDPDAIIDDVARGMEGAAYERIPDRRRAINHALGAARPGDLVLLAGKGHERYQVVGTEKRPFDEREVVREFFARVRDGVT